jgi:lactoylglutathione lyase
MQSMIRKVNAVVLFVQDLDRSMRFYRDTLDLDVVVSDDVSFAFRMEGQDFAIVKLSEGMNMLNEEVLALKQGAGHRVMLCADVEDVDATYESLTAKGVIFIKPPIDQPWGWRAAYFADPEGNIWELRESIPAQ